MVELQASQASPRAVDRLADGPGDEDLAWALSRLAWAASQGEVSAAEVLDELAAITAMVMADGAVAASGVDAATSGADEVALRDNVAMPSAASWGGRDRAAVILLAQVAASSAALIRERDQARAAQRDWQHRATHDALTGLPNRLLLVDRLEHELHAAVRRASSSAVLFIDIDRFKDVNDTFGHGEGDRVLVEVARRLSATLRAEDTLARLAGDEFVVVCGDLSGSPDQVHEQLLALGRRIGEELHRGPHVLSAQWPVSVSIGVVVTTQWHDGEDLIRRADRAMYRAKQRAGTHLVIDTFHG
jgi:diguanylate cyclase (GGDEF)-like protein